MRLSAKEITKIQEVLYKFPSVDTFELTESKHSGIGSILTMSFDQEINDMKTKVSVEISGVEDW